MAKKHAIEKLEDVNDEIIETKSVKKTAMLKQKVHFHLRNLVSTKKRKILVIIASILVLVAVVFAIPFTRYFALSPFVKKDVTVKIIDSKTDKPVSNVSIKLDDITSQTDKDGKAVFKSVPVGDYALKVTKQYYQDYTTHYQVPVLSAPESPSYDINAVGRQIVVSVANKISGDKVSDVVIEASGTKATTDSEGLATIILPPNEEVLKATLSKEGYIATDVELKVDEAIVNTYAISPAGSIYYLSKATGKINIMKSNLDGTGATAVVAGTGQESDYETSLLSSRDWQYSALSATRTDNKQRLYLLSANKDELSLIDEGDATFTMTGWSGHNFIYTVYRNVPNVWDSKRQAVKSYNADTRKVTVLDETSATGSSSYDASYENYSGIYIMKDEIVYAKTWYYNNYYFASSDGNKPASLYSVSPTGGSKKTIKTFPPAKSVSLRLYEPQGLYVQVSNPSTYYEYEDGKLKDVSGISDNQFNSFYPTFLISPSAKQTLWYEPRDGKNTVFIGNDKGKDAKTIGNLSEYTPYGWYGQNDEYILLTKSGSELYISSASKTIGVDSYQPLKVTDYHKTRTYPGYGYGYGGQ